MPTIRYFEDLSIWKEAIELVGKVYSITNYTSFHKDYGLTDQIRRAAVSIPSNISEGFERESDMDFKRFLYIAKGSAGEVRTQLLVAHKLSYINAEAYDQLRKRLISISVKLSRFIKYLAH
ncbi:MAG: four helix bundle protein [Patescibacteria group bacterium]|jgi:four helix bundle protein